MSVKPLVLSLHSTVPTVGFEPRPLWPYVFSCPMLYPLSHSGLHICNCLELLLLPEFVKINWISISCLVFLQVAAHNFPCYLPSMHDVFTPNATELRLHFSIHITQSNDTGKPILCPSPWES